MANPKQVSAARKGYFNWKTNPEAGKARNAQIVEKRRSGATLAECGQLFGLTAERARQICRKADLNEKREGA